MSSNKLENLQPTVRFVRNAEFDVYPIRDFLDLKVAKRVEPFEISSKSSFPKLNEDWDRYFIGMAEYVSKRSKDPSTKVGAVIVDADRRVISTGYNGLPHCLPDHEAILADRERKLKHIIHAEENSLYFCNSSVKNTCLYTFPMLSCVACVNRMLQVGVKRFVSFGLEQGTDRYERWNKEIEETKALIILAGAEWKTYI